MEMDSAIAFADIALTYSPRENMDISKSTGAFEDHSLMRLTVEV